MRTTFFIFTFFVIAFFMHLTSPVNAGSCFGPSSCFGVGDVATGVAITATPDVITAGEETHVRFTGSALHTNEEMAQCTANFPYTVIEGSLTDMGNGNWNQVIAGGYVNDYPTATRTYTITCPGWYTQNGVTYATENTDSVTVTVNPASAVDLTASVISPISVSSNQEVTFSSTISNVGVQATPSGFTTLFQLSPDQNGSLVSDMGTFVRATSLAPSSSFAATWKVNFGPLANDSFVYYRACADKSSSGNGGIINESSEANNCGPWQRVDILATPALSVSCSALPPSGTTGQNITWTASASGGTGNYLYTWTGSAPLSGTGNPKSVTYTTPGTKTASVTVTSGAQTTGPVSCTSGGGGNPAGGGTVTITNAAPVATLTCSPASCTGITGTVQLHYACQNSTSATLTQFGSLSPVSSGNRTAILAGPYQLACTGPGGTAQANRTVSFTTPTSYITATPDRVNVGGSTSVSWSANQVTSCTVSANGVTIASPAGPVVATTTVSRTVAGQTTFAIACDSNATTDSVIVNVVPKVEEF